MKKEIIEKTNELQKVMIAFTEIDESEKNLKLIKEKLHYDLSIIRDEIRELTRTL